MRLVGLTLSVFAASALNQQTETYWAFQPVSSHTPPVIHDDSLVRTPIDRFVLEKLEKRRLVMNPEAKPSTLIRRMFYDLIGLPPSPDEVAAFLEAHRRDPEAAVSKVIDVLLASPHYGERWGRHWLDVAGYSDSNGFITDSGRPEAWRYRDYVIRSFNEDKPYNQFLLEQFAGDELVPWRNMDIWTPEVVEKLTATGFLRCTPDGTDNQTMFQLDKRWDRLLTGMETALKAAIGLNFNCVRCHDSKFDPFSQEDYYSLLAAFQPAYDPNNWIAANNRYGVKWPVRFLYVASRDQREEFAKKVSVIANRMQQNRLRVKQLKIEYFNKWLIKRARQETESTRQRLLEALRISPEARDDEASMLVAEFKGRFTVDDQLLSEAFLEFKSQLAELNRQYEKHEKTLEEAEPEQKIWALWDVSAEILPESRVLRRGNFQNPEEAVEFNVPRVLGRNTVPFSPPDTNGKRTSAGRRLALARWIAHENHPLTGRVIVNRVWQYHFGRGIVTTPDDFGAQGARPSHPKLLDWLARWFVDHGWSIKDLHRLIMHSHVYRQSSEWIEARASVDPENRLWWRRDRRRLEAEAIRDAMLAVSGTLDTRLFGKPVTVKKLADGPWIPDPKNPNRHRRSVYLEYKRNRIASFLRVFDAPDFQTNEPHRFVSTVPLQSLSLMNNPFVQEMATSFAKHLVRERPHDVNQRVERAFQLAFGRPPTLEEARMCLSLAVNDPNDWGRWKTICHGLLASNEFMYVD